VDSNPSKAMDVCVGLFCVCVVLRVGGSLAKIRSSVQGVLPSVYKVKVKIFLLQAMEAHKVARG
jgi:hypothetical protein